VISYVTRVSLCTVLVALRRDRQLQCEEFCGKYGVKLVPSLRLLCTLARVDQCWWRDELSIIREVEVKCGTAWAGAFKSSIRVS
jgi:hypothetical protein